MGSPVVTCLEVFLGFCLQASLKLREGLLQICKELLPSVFGALIGLLLIRPEARLLHAQMGPRARWGERPGHHTLETMGRPGVRQRLVGLDCQDLTIDGAPICAQAETVI